MGTVKLFKTKDKKKYESKPVWHGHNQGLC